MFFNVWPGLAMMKRPYSLDNLHPAAKTLLSQDQSELASCHEER
jgi:hypothetical protein